MIFEEETVNREEIYHGALLHVVKDEVKLPDDSHSFREMILHPGASAVFPFTSDDRLVLVKQYRKPLERVLYEVPAGKIDGSDKDPIDTIKRELEEETGYGANEWYFYRTSAIAVGYSNELIHFYIAKDLYPIKNARSSDPDEFVEVVTLAYEELQDLEKSGELLDAKTQMALDYWTMERLKRKLDSQ